MSAYSVLHCPSLFQFPRFKNHTYMYTRSQTKRSSVYSMKESLKPLSSPLYVNGQQQHEGLSLFFSSPPPTDLMTSAGHYNGARWGDGDGGPEKHLSMPGTSTHWLRPFCYTHIIFPQMLLTCQWKQPHSLKYIQTHTIIDLCQISTCSPTHAQQTSVNILHRALKHVQWEKWLDLFTLRQNVFVLHLSAVGL